MKNILLWCFLIINIQALDNNKYDVYKLEDTSGFCPIKQEQPLRFPNQDICEIIWDEELRDCTGFDEGTGSPTPDSSPTDMQEFVFQEESK